MVSDSYYYGAIRGVCQRNGTSLSAAEEGILYDFVSQCGFGNVRGDLLGALSENAQLVYINMRNKVRAQWRRTGATPDVWPMHAQRPAAAATGRAGAAAAFEERAELPPQEYGATAAKRHCTRTITVSQGASRAAGVAGCSFPSSAASSDVAPPSPSHTWARAERARLAGLSGSDADRDSVPDEGPELPVDPVWDPSREPPPREAGGQAGGRRAAAAREKVRLVGWDKNQIYQIAVRAIADEWERRAKAIEEEYRRLSRLQDTAPPSPVRGRPEASAEAERLRAQLEGALARAAQLEEQLEHAVGDREGYRIAAEKAFAEAQAMRGALQQVMQWGLGQQLYAVELIGARALMALHLRYLQNELAKRGGEDKWPGKLGKMPEDTRPKLLLDQLFQQTAGTVLGRAAADAAEQILACVQRTDARLKANTAALEKLAAEQEARMQQLQSETLEALVQAKAEARRLAAAALASEDEEGLSDGAAPASWEQLEEAGDAPSPDAAPTATNPSSTTAPTAAGRGGQ